MYVWIATCNPYCESCPDRYANSLPACQKPKFDVDPNCGMYYAFYDTTQREDVKCRYCNAGYILDKD